MRAAAAAGADLAEVRVDLLSPEELPKWQEIVAGKCLPVIVTNRAAWEGGKWRGSDTERLQILAEAEGLGAEHIDVELAACEQFQSLRTAPLPGHFAKLILSHHNFERPLTKAEVETIRVEMRGAKADIFKIAMMATNALDNALVFETLATAEEPTIFLAMGEMGQVSRIAAAKYGAYLTFASVGAGRESAPGQVDTERLTSFFRFRDVNASTPLYGIIGNPVSHSMSPALHNTAMADKNLDGLYVYLKVDDDAADFIRKMSSLGFAGFSVTMPSKVDAMKAMDDIDPTTKGIGAMNTVVKQKDGSLKGYNTDWIAAISAIEDDLPSKSLAGLRVVCIGAGGAGRALAYGALERGAGQVVIVNRSKPKAVALASDLSKDRAIGMSLEEFNADADVNFDVVMNTTSVGMNPNPTQTPVVASKLARSPLVFDAVYNPVETRLLREAKANGCVVVSGFEMFVRQGAEQFRLWHPSVDPPLQLMRQTVAECLGIELPSL